MRLSPIFRRLAQSVLFASAACLPAALGACSGEIAYDGADSGTGADGSTTDGSTVDGGVDGGRIVVPPTFTDELCGANGYEPLADLGIAARYDAYALTYAGATPRAAQGTLCASATDRPACDAALAAAMKENSGWGQGDFLPEFFVASNAGGLTTARTEAELRALLAPVRTAHAAALALRPAGYYAVCPGAKSLVGKDRVEVVLQKGHGCGSGDDIVQSRIAVAADGTATVLETVLLEAASPGCAVGRRFEELGVVAACTEDSLGEFLAKIAYLEAAAVHAFARLEAELAHHGAPVRLLNRVRQARRDEVRHAATMTKLAVRHGGVVPSVEEPTRAVPSIEEIAMENRVEGCLRESYGAAVAAFQAARATDPRIAQALARIAVDEAAHAELSWAIDAWATAKLDRRARGRMDVAYAEAREALRSEVALSYRAEVTEGAGMPTAAQAIALLDGMLAVLARAA